MVPPNVTEALFASVAVAGVCAALWRNARPRPVPEVEETVYLRRHRALASIVASFASLQQPEQTGALVAMLERCLVDSGCADGEKRTVSEWTAHRNANDILRHCRGMMARAKRSRNADVLERLIIISDTDFPALESILDKLMNNMILSRP